jgi:hypothetical protein
MDFEAGSSSLVMHASSFATSALVILLLAGGSFTEAASLKACKQACTQSVQADCLGLRKGKLKKCRKRIWKACKRGKTTCQVVASSTTSSSTTAPTATTTTITTAPTTSTTSTTTTTTITLPPDDITFAGTWSLDAVAITDTCMLGDGHDTVEVHGSATLAAAVFTTNAGFPHLTGAVTEDGDLLVSADTPGQTAGCAGTITLRMDGPLDVSAETTTGSASITDSCDGTLRCQTTYNCSFRRLAGN